VTSPQTPEWVRDAVFYQIFPDRFARSLTVPKPNHLDAWGSAPTYHGYQGGDLIGVVEHLDYLGDLGITALYFTPIFQSASNHRYHTHDYHKVDPMLGGDAALKRLIDEAHARGMRVVLDGVFNHSSRGFFQFHDILENGPDSAYLDWFTVKGFPLNAYDSQKPLNYQAWWGLPALPKFNTDCAEVREFLWDVGRRWIEFGIDGWRLDVPNEIDDDSFWREFRTRVRHAKPDAYIVGEIWTDAERWLKGDMWDAVMNYQFTRACIAFFIGESLNEDELRKTSLFPVGTSTAQAFRQSIERLLNLYHATVSSAMLNLLGSHDVARFITLARGDRSALELATTFQMTYLGPPSVYYGDEIGMSGGRDPANRGAFPWHKTDTWDTDLLHRFQRLIALRQQRPALRCGSFQFLWAQDAVVAVCRQLGDDTVITLFNASRDSRRLDLPVGDVLPDGTVLAECWTESVSAVEQSTLHDLNIAPRSARIFASRMRRSSSLQGEQCPQY
jgi:neopullulanase